MKEKLINFGFSYFSSEEYFLDNQLDFWFQEVQKWGGSYLLFMGNFKTLVPEQIFFKAKKFGLEPIIHFKTKLPSAKTFNDSAFFLDLYKKWGAKYIVLGDQPNMKQDWLTSLWHDGTLVNHFLDCFIPLANHALKIGLQPIMAPLTPGGDYWDCAFLELFLDGLNKRKMAALIDPLILSSYGFTFNLPLSWGAGGPERWPNAKPYSNNDGQQNQIGFHNFEWLQAVSQRVVGRKMPVIILDAGNPGEKSNSNPELSIEDSLQKILMACNNINNLEEGDNIEMPVFNESVVACLFSLETVKALLGENCLGTLNQIFLKNQAKKIKANMNHKLDGPKYIEHYLLLPAYTSGVSDVVLNKVKPLIKKLKPTIGFSLEEAVHASKVSIYPDQYLFSEDQINQLRSAGCEVEILPQSGMEIATLLQD
jgi:hypothetical protein